MITFVFQANKRRIMFLFPSSHHLDSEQKQPISVSHMRPHRTAAPLGQPLKPFKRRYITALHCTILSINRINITSKDILSYCSWTWHNVTTRLHFCQFIQDIVDQHQLFLLLSPPLLLACILIATGTVPKCSAPSTNGPFDQTPPDGFARLPFFQPLDAWIRRRRRNSRSSFMCSCVYTKYKQYRMHHYTFHWLTADVRL